LRRLGADKNNLHFCFIFKTTNIMAHIEFNPNQPIQSLSGNLGPLSFRTRNGKTTVFATPEPVLPKNPTRKQRELYRQKTVVDDCTAVIQKRIHDIPKALEMRALIRNRILRLYKLFAPNIKSRTKLLNNILVEYDLRYDASESSQHRESIETSSRLKRNQTPH
jgi:hypothetical protein